VAGWADRERPKRERKEEEDTGRTGEAGNIWNGRNGDTERHRKEGTLGRERRKQSGIDRKREVGE
jgi:hypothetical protein